MSMGFTRVGKNTKFWGKHMRNKVRLCREDFMSGHIDLQMYCEDKCTLFPCCLG